MRGWFALIVVAVAVAACGSKEEPAATPQGTKAAATSPCAKPSLSLFAAGKLTIGTDKPAYPPYFSDDDPTNGKGFESAVAYAVARELGFDKTEVEWTVVPFNPSY